MPALSTTVWSAAVAGSPAIAATSGDGARPASATASALASAATGRIIV